MTPIWQGKLALHRTETYSYVFSQSDSQPFLPRSQGWAPYCSRYSCWFCHSRKAHNRCTAVPPTSWGIKPGSQSVCLFPQHYSSHILTSVFGCCSQKSVATLLSRGPLQPAHKAISFSIFRLCIPSKCLLGRPFVILSFMPSLVSL